MKKVANFLIKLSNILNILGENLKYITLQEEFYVYVPSRNKPRFVHHSFKEADKEAQRIKALVQNAGLDEDVEILQIVKKYKAEIPF